MIENLATFISNMTKKIIRPTLMLVTVVVLILSAAISWAADDRSTEEENAILALIIREYHDSFSIRLYGKTLYVVSPKTIYWEMTKPHEIESLKKYIKDNLPFKYATYKLVDRFFERNMQPVQLTMKSSPEDGYVIDYDGKYERYCRKKKGNIRSPLSSDCEKNGEAIWTWRVSMPAYDLKAGYVLIYMACHVNPLFGHGFLVLYRYENGKIKRVQEVMIWSS